MITDLHTRVWNAPDQFGAEISRLLRLRQSDRWIRLDASAAALNAATECVDVAVVHGFRAQRLDAHIPSELIAEVVRAAPDRRLGVAGVDPMAGDPRGQVDAAAALGMIGISVSPMAAGFHPTHSQAMRLYERCSERGLPVFVSRGVPLSPSGILEFGRPSAWDEVARSFPTVPIVIGELGYPWVDETLVLVGKHENVWAEVSGVASRPWQLYNAMLTAFSLGVMEKLLFGSGFPHETPARAIENLYSLNALGHGTQLPSVPRATVRAIVERDSLRALGVEVAGLAPRVRSVASGASATVPAGARLAEGETDESSTEGIRPGDRPGES
ncbi:MAG: amidohydrolase family protein [Phycisphaerales bacterium]